jgi:hypothetical protein
MPSYLPFFENAGVGNTMHQTLVPRLNSRPWPRSKTGGPLGRVVAAGSWLEWTLAGVDVGWSGRLGRLSGRDAGWGSVRQSRDLVRCSMLMRKIALLFLRKLFHDLQRLIADVVFDAFGVNGSIAFTDTECS